MQVTVRPSILNGEINIPTSKSMMQRICAAALLHKGTCLVKDIGIADDDKVAIDVIQQLGATVNQKSSSSIEIVSEGIINASGEILCGESGLSTRLFTIISSLSPNEVTITGSGSLVNRSMVPFEELFQELGVSIKDFNGTLPITIKGPLVPQAIHVDGSLSSQFLSGLLIAFAFTVNEEVTISVANLVSRPYVDMTLEVLKYFGKEVINNDYKAFMIKPSASTVKNVSIDVEGDWSSASFWLVAGAIRGSVRLSGLSLNSSQADIAILAVLKESGINYIVEDGVLSIQSLKGVSNSFSFDATHAPDLFPILSIYASLCNGVSRIKGVHRLSQKESNRAVSIKEMLSAFGVQYREDDDELEITGQEVLKATTIDSCNDHRIAMAATIGALYAKGECRITNAEAINKSYPDFYNHLQSLGGFYEIDK